MTLQRLIESGFYGAQSPKALLERFGSPLYVYNEAELRKRCRDLTQGLPGLQMDYSVKANGNLSLLRIIREEGFQADAMSPGEVTLLLAAGFAPEEILYVCNNVGDDELDFIHERGIRVSVDSLSQLERWGRLFPGSEVAIRFNPGVGAGHNEKVITAGRKTKFAIMPEDMEAVKALLGRYKLRLCGINQHIGSHFMDPAPYLAGVRALLDIAKQLAPLPMPEFIDFGGGFGIPYHKGEREARLALDGLWTELKPLLEAFCAETGAKPRFRAEPGRYVVAECGALLGTVHSIKTNYDTTYIGTDIGFNVLMRPILYDAYHEIEVYSEAKGEARPVTVVGNICESGDKLAVARLLPPMNEDDAIGVCDAGAYGMSMASAYNSRPLPAEVLIDNEGLARLIRRRGTLEELLISFP